MGLLQGGHAGVILGHEQEGVPHAGLLHRLLHGFCQGGAIAALGLELHQQAQLARGFRHQLEHLLQGGDVLPGLAVARGQQWQGGELLRGEVGHAAVLPRQPPEVPVVEDHRHPVGGDLHVYHERRAPGKGSFPGGGSVTPPPPACGP